MYTREKCAVIGNAFNLANRSGESAFARLCTEVSSGQQEAHTTERDIRKSHELLTLQSDMGMPPKRGEIRIGQRQDGILGTASGRSPMG